jgi:hypothetical protein
VPDRDLAGEADEQVQRQRGEGEDGDVGQLAVLVGLQVAEDREHEHVGDGEPAQDAEDPVGATPLCDAKRQAPH